MQVKLTILLLLISLSFPEVFAQDHDRGLLFKRTGYGFPYYLSKPDQTWKMPRELVEISGVSYIDNQHLACIQDEEGIIFIFNLETGKITSEINFSENGDYEDIAIVQNDAWVLKSNGTLYKLKEFLNQAQPSSRKHSTELSGKNNAEGLGYDPVRKSLLIACKGFPYLDDKDGSGFKAIYQFDPETKLLDSKPFILINLDTISHYKNYDAMTRLGTDMMAYLDPSAGDKTFQPSGIAIQPGSGNIFILGSVGKLLLVLSGNGELLAMVDLPEKIFPQPEGICFSPDGTLYISNEGAGRDGTILEFDPKN